MTVRDIPDGLSRPLGDVLLTPTSLYVSPVRRLIAAVPVKGMAHITGGGISGNLPRILPDGTAAEITPARWPVPDIFRVVQKYGKIDLEEMCATFNMGVGMILVVPQEAVETALRTLSGLKQAAFAVGKIVPGNREVRYV